MGKNFTDQELDAVQADYWLWAKRNKARALRRRVWRNRWLKKHGRERHTVTAAQITLL